MFVLLIDSITENMLRVEINPRYEKASPLKKIKEKY
jgi:hypothetical protein